MPSEMKQKPIRNSRRALLDEIQALAPHEVKCRCGRGETFKGQSHLPECPRWQIWSMLDSLQRRELRSKEAVAEWLRSEEASEIAFGAISTGPSKAGGVIGALSNALNALAREV